MSLLDFMISIQPRRPDVVGGATVVPDNTAYSIGETITVTVTGGPGAAANAVGLYLLGDDPSVDLPVNDLWKYLESNDQNLPVTGAVNDVVTFSTTGLAPGSYVAHLLDEGFEDEPPPPSDIFEVAGGPNGIFFGDLASATRDITHNFAADANYCVVLISYEESSVSIFDITIDPAGAAIPMTQLGTPVVNSGTTAVVFYAHSLSLSGVKTIRVFTSAAEYLTVEATSWRNADNMAPAPTGTALLTGTSTSIPLTGCNPDGHLVMVANVNASPTINPSGGISINRQDNSPVDGWQGVTASQAPPISPSATPALSLSSSQRVAARAFVVNPVGGTPEPPPVSTLAPRIIITTDIGEDPDDQQSMIRLLHYANEFRIVGMIATQDPALTGGPPGFTHTRPDLIRNHIEDYRLVLLNLQNHATGWPDPDDLLDLVKHGADVGTVAASVGTGKDTEGSELIIEAVDASSELTWITIFGGQVDLAQALFSAQARKGGASGSAFLAFLAKIRVYAIADQDPGLSAYIRGQWPTLWYVENGPNGLSGQYNQQFRGMHQRDSESGIELVPTAWMALSTTAWVTTNIHGHGALGAAYPTDALINPQVGNNTGGGVKEGDTPAWFYLLHRGMQDPLQQTWGGWGGRFAQVSGSYYTDTLDTITWSAEAQASTAARRKWPIARWRVDYQNDFQARADWARTGTYSSCSHHPIAAVDNDVTKTIVFRTVPAGSSVSLSAIGSTTDLGATTGLTYNWMYYQEVTNGPAVTITNATSRDASFIAPAAGPVLHFILTVRNSGSPAPVLAAYRRVVVTVGAAIGALETVNSAHLQVAINVQTAPRQTWLGYGWGAASINMTHWTAAAVTRLCEDMGATIVRYFTPETGATFLSAHQAHWNLVSAHGINKIFSSSFVYRTANPSDIAPNIVGAANGIDAVMDGGINPSGGWWATLQNEPDGHVDNNPTTDGINTATQAQIRAHHVTFRSQLNSLGRSAVKVLGLEYRHPQTLIAEFDAFNIAPSLYTNGTVQGQCFHVYDDGARNEYYDNRIQTVGGNFFSTECGDNGFDVSAENTVVNLTSPYTAARFIAAINAGAEVEIHHAAVGTVDNDGKVQSLIHASTGLPRGGWYAACKIISKNMIPGTVMRLCLSTDTPPGLASGNMPAIQASRMIIDSATCQCQPRQLVAYGVRPDGRRVLVAVNHAYDSISETTFAGGHFPAPSSPGPNQQLTVTDPFLQSPPIDRAWSGQRATRAGVESVTTVNMHDGILRFTLVPGETIAITMDP